MRLIDTPEWKKHCMQERRRVLTGEKAHYCYDWDQLTVDETTPEFEGCTCFPREPSI